ncbi:MULTISPECIES: sporulation membrane protein YtaF [Bacillales]|uniref:Sporulation membrane protein YtaF n=1 Tax=Brevibacillus aydinogluensis TaxID=927786 RepID=A0AA48RJ30_9BACL|nr:MULTISPECIES: sporulation membrane protein YtaF [Bacillales]REK65501.1 MAG: sporulation membrane protein YtaF [Brevibacillus sp.]MBR8660762.1 sporulation membrane protein YtaF [Brevibacillus sp. NL20B1]MDT3417256.1 putative sporulation protein YtaF [Brevibacillus aydinogluensis]NNV03180.1 sporulation membrane protein YtaF [Brevibacillus sp. MCWH]UFJ62499.1 sporulation membrane protein YtaF [Anoxybacillus sediminis]
MSGWFSLLLVSLAISMDSVSVGMTYGLRNMRMPFLSLVVVAGCSFSVVYAVMTVGSTLTFWLSPEWGKRVGAAVLVGLGLFTLWRLFSPRADSTSQDDDHRQKEAEQALVSQFRAFGLIIQILRDPSRADADRSGHIMGWEAVMLGLALSLDAFGAGISLAFFGYPPLSVALCIAVMSAALLALGIALGRRAGQTRWLSRLTWLPPILLICIGLAKSIT